MVEFASERSASPVGVRVLCGDLFSSRCEAWVNPVNTVGVMGAGLALAFRRRFPAMVRDYQLRCRRRLVRPGEPYLYRQPSGPSILCFPTKRHWRDPARLEDVLAGLLALPALVAAEGLRSLAVPALGCGLGGLAWPEVRPHLERHLGELGIPVELYAPR